MARTFESWGLPVPPVPAALQPSVLAHGTGCWATRAMVGFDMYFWTMSEAEEVLAGRASEYVAVSHAGHGANSYAVTYHLVYRGLALFMQEAWGGAYMDNRVQAAKLAGMFDRCAELLGRCSRQQPDRWLLCLDSRLRGTSACGWVPAGDDLPLPRFLRECAVDKGTALAHAERLLS